MFFQESEDLLPPVHRLLLPVIGSVVVKKAVPRIWIHMKFITLSVLFQFFFVQCHLFRGGAVIFRAKET